MLLYFKNIIKLSSVIIYQYTKCHPKQHETIDVVLASPENGPERTVTLLGTRMAARFAN
jgi:hypothetical protein